MIKTKYPKPKIDNRSFSYSNRRNEITDTIKKFVLPNNELKRLDLKNKPLVQLFNNWGLENTNNLPLRSPVDLSPFQFHSKYNGDESYILNPRLSVTKLLIDRWCELREYYTIYASSPKYKTTPQLQLGLDLHLKLEVELHESVNIEVLSSKLGDIIFKKSLNNSPLICGHTKESDNAMELCEKVIERLFKLLTTSECREILTHGFLDAKNHSIIDSFNLNKTCTFPDDAILISGIVDSLSLINPNNEYDYSLFEEIQHYIDNEYTKINDTHKVDLSSFFNDVQSILSNYRDNYKLKITDVKSRSFNKIPPQNTVLNSAKLQTFYYLKFLNILSQEKDEFCYTSLSENLKIKGCDIDAPINLRTVLVLLRKYPHLLLQDFIKLSKGEAIGFQPYDDYASRNYSTYDYGFQSFLDKDDIGFLSEENFNFEMLSPLLINWKYPLTLRYFIARASQFYKLLIFFKSDTTTIEYHNSKTGYCFKIIKYRYIEEELDNHVKQTSTFWMGDRPPLSADDLSKCKYCEFESKCTIPNMSPNNKKIGLKLKSFLQTASQD